MIARNTRAVGKYKLFPQIPPSTLFACTSHSRRVGSSLRKTEQSACIVEEGKVAGVPNHFSIVKKLGKMRLTLFVAASSVAGASLADVPLQSLGVLAVGVTALSLSANTGNQCLEVSEDRMMRRTNKRPLVTGEISLKGAMTIALVEFFIGSCLLYQYSLGCCFLGVLNWAIYVLVYTPCKKLTVWNTEIGAIVGAIPPIMGGLYLDNGIADITGPLWLGVVLYFWQLPHFLALSYLCRKDYQKAGYRMIASSSMSKTCGKKAIYTVLLSVSVIVGPSFLGFQYPAVYFFTSTMLMSVLVLKTALFCYFPARFCRECFVFSYVWLGLQLMLIIFSHLYQQRNAHINKVVEA